jgi:Meiosis protein SPO22/ZIP4 like
VRKSKIAKQTRVGDTVELTWTMIDIPEGNPRLVRLGLASAKLCLRLSTCTLKLASLTAADCKQDELASQILERVAVYTEERSEGNSSNEKAANSESTQLVLEYSSLRMALVRAKAFLLSSKLTERCQSWQQKRLDLAEHFYAKMDLALTKCAPATAEDIIDLLFEIGKCLLDQRCCTTAILWLERAYRLLTSQHVGLLSQDAGELRLNLLHTFGSLDHPGQYSSADSSFEAKSVLYTRRTLLNTVRESASSWRYY